MKVLAFRGLVFPNTAKFCDGTFLVPVPEQTAGPSSTVTDGEKILRINPPKYGETLWQNEVSELSGTNYKRYYPRGQSTLKNAENM